MMHADAMADADAASAPHLMSRGMRGREGGEATFEKELSYFLARNFGPKLLQLQLPL